MTKPIKPPAADPLTIAFSDSGSMNLDLGGLKGQVHIKCVSDSADGNAHIRFGNGSQTADTDDWPMLHGDVEEYEIRDGETNAAAIGATGISGTIYIRPA